MFCVARPKGLDDSGSFLLGSVRKGDRKGLDAMIVRTLRRRFMGNFRLSLTLSEKYTLPDPAAAVDIGFGLLCVYALMSLMSQSVIFLPVR